jgi:predicted secreted protein
MGWVTAVILYWIIWWVTLFAVLPLWVKPSEPDDPGFSVGAPQHPRLVRKALVTTLAATVVWLVIYALIRSPWLSFRGS